MQTNLMRADEIANGFNSVTERRYWRAVVAGTRVNPEVHFNSRASMVRVTYRIATADFTVSFSRTSAAFGDFLASTYRSLEQVFTSLKAAGLPFPAMLDGEGVLRVQYDPRAKTVAVAVAFAYDQWTEAEPMPFKVPERKTSENAFPAIDGL